MHAPAEDAPCFCDKEDDDDDDECDDEYQCQNMAMKQQLLKLETTILGYEESLRAQFPILISSQFSAGDDILLYATRLRVWVALFALHYEDKCRESADLPPMYRMTPHERRQFETTAVVTYTYTGDKIKQFHNSERETYVALALADLFELPDVPHPMSPEVLRFLQQTLPIFDRCNAPALRAAMRRCVKQRLVDLARSEDQIRRWLDLFDGFTLPCYRDVGHALTTRVFDRVAERSCTDVIELVLPFLLPFHATSDTSSSASDESDTTDAGQRRARGTKRTHEVAPPSDDGDGGLNNSDANDANNRHEDSDHAPDAKRRKM